MRKDPAPYPAPFAPETWEMDDIFTRLLDRQEKLWRKKGYVWEWALELEFTPQRTEEFDFYLKQQHIHLRDGEPFQREIKNAHAHYQKLTSENILPNVEFATQTIAKLLKFYRDPQNENYLSAYLSHPKIRMTIEEAILELKEFRKNLKDSTKELAEVSAIENRNQSQNGHKITQEGIQRLAISDIMMAYLHTFPREKGGIADQVEPRFGSRGYGFGWWDGPGTIEVRIPPLDDARKYIETYYDLIAHITETVMKFGLVPNFAAAQVNFNVRRLSDNKNMMLIEDEAGIDFHKRMLGGIYRLLDEAPHLKSDLQSSDNADEFFTMSAHNTKLASFNLHPTRWEIRRSANNGYMHMAQELAFLMTGTGHAMFNVRNIDAYIKRNKSPIMAVTVPVTTQRYPRVTHCLEELISTAYILGNGQLYANPLALSHYDICLMEVGEHNAGLVSIPLDDSDGTEIARMDLRSKAGWQYLLRSCTISADDQLVMDKDLHAEISDAFANVIVTGRRKMVTGQEQRVLYGTSLSRNLNLITDSAILKASMPLEDIEALKEGYARILETKHIRRGLEISGAIQDELTDERKMYWQLADSFAKITKGEKELSSHSPDNVIRRQAYSFIAMPHIREHRTLADHWDRCMTPERLRASREQRRPDLIGHVTRIKQHSQIVVADLRAQADRLERENRGDNRLPEIADDFRKAAAYIENDVHDPRNYVDRLTGECIERLGRMAEKGNVGPYEAAAMCELLESELSMAIFHCFWNERFDTEECASIYGEIYDMAAAHFSKALAEEKAKAPPNRFIEKCLTMVTEAMEGYAGEAPKYQELIREMT